jgi:glycosyltransferase involved in cell wall biosynthesis
VRIIRNGARLKAFQRPDPAARDRLRQLASGPGPTVLAAGRLSPEKGFAVLLEAARWLRQAVPEARVVVFGDGPERPALERRIVEYGLNEIVRLPGFRDDLDALLPWADVVVLPSFTEGLPNVALEAGAAGVPVVATAVGGTPEVVVNGQTGFLVPAGDPTTLAARVADMLRNPDWAGAFGQAARRRMENLFSFEGQARAYAQLFDEITSTRVRGQERPVPACV